MPDAGQGEPGRLATATLAARRLEDVSDVLLLFAYGLALLAVALGAAPAFAAQGLAPEWRLLSALGGLLAGAVTFILLKYVSEGTRALADVARVAARVDAQVDALILAERQRAGEAAPPAPAERTG